MFTHLHVHTEYSLLDGMARISDLMDRAQALGQEAIAMTDHGALYGAIDFYREATKRGIKPIIGVETYVAPTSRHTRDRSEGQPYHLVLLARNREGYRNLVQLVTKAQLEGYYYRPRIDRELLEQHSEGLLALSGCPSSEFFRHLLDGNREAAIETAKWYREVLDGHYYLEVQDHGDPKFTPYNAHIADIGRELGIPVVATNDSHYTSPEQAIAHEVLLCIGTNTTIHDEKRFKLEGQGYYLRSEEEMRALFPDNPEFCDNTQLVADACDLTLDFSRSILPEPDIPEGRDSHDYLRELCQRSLESKYDTVTEELQQRLDYELDVLYQTGFTDYMYVVKETADTARRLGIRMGVRGSAAASLVLYLLGVTDIDPVANRLVFERFLNLERREMPDVDFDFADDRRDEMIRWAYERYGHDRVAQIITFGTLGAKAALRDVGRALGMTYADTDRVARLVPNQLGITLGDALEQTSELRDLVSSDPQVRKLVETARQLEGVSRHASTHAAGVVISRDPLVDTVPLQRPPRGDESSIPTTQFAMEQISSIGLLKMDYLGLSNLTILQGAIDLIRETRGEEIDLWALPDGDPKAMKMLGEGQTFGVFQLESAGMRRYIQDLKPTSIADLCAMVALYRPGPMQHIPRFIQGKHGEIEITYPHPDLAEILDETYGVIVYQDQVLLIARKFAGYSLGQADIMRKAMGKKKKEVMEAERERFVGGAIEKGYSKEDAEKVFALIEPFAGYAFNKSHSWCYGHIAYQTAWLKANYPVEYMTALLRLTHSAPDPHARIAAAVAECSRLGIDVLLPDINRSEVNFSIETREDGTQAIRFGLGIAKNVGNAAAQGMVAGRSAPRDDESDEPGGPYTDLEDFLLRADLTATNARALEHLIKAGALDVLAPEHDRGTLVASAENMLAFARSERERRESNQSDMFSMLGSEAPGVAPQLRLEHNPVADEVKLGWEKELLGVYVSDHPYKRVAPAVRGYVSHELADLTMEIAGQTVTVAGLITRVEPRATRDGRRFLVVTLEDLETSAELLIWSDALETTGEAIWEEGKVLAVAVECRDRGDRLGITVRRAVEFDRDTGQLIGDEAATWEANPRDQPAPRRGGPPQRNGGAPGGPPPYANGNVNGARASGAPRPAANGNGNGNGNGHAAGTNGQAAAVRESVRFDVSIYETENVRADRVRLGSLLDLLRGSKGDNTVRLVIHEAGGSESPFELDFRVSATEQLVQDVRDLLQKNGDARITSSHNGNGH